MINELQYNVVPLTIYDEVPTTISLPQENIFEIEQPINKKHVSSLCFQIKKKISRQKRRRPSLLKVEEYVRNVSIYTNLVSSQTLDDFDTH